MAEASDFTPVQLALLRKQCASTRAGRAAVEAGTFDALFDQHVAEITLTRMTYAEGSDAAHLAEHYANPCIGSTVVLAPAERLIVPHLDHTRARWRVRGWLWSKGNLHQRRISLQEADLV